MKAIFLVVIGLLVFLGVLCVDWAVENMMENTTVRNNVKSFQAPTWEEADKAIKSGDPEMIAADRKKRMQNVEHCRELIKELKDK